MPVAQKVYPKLAHGRFRTVKWLVMAVTLGIYYALPWLRWHRGPDLPDQAVLLDMAHNRFFFFFLEIWPQEFYFVTGLLVLAALALFLVTSVAGRVWCGYTCPQTVWTDLMVLVERFWQGDRNARIRLDKRRWGPVKIFKKGMTHLSWLAIGLATGGALVFYFRDAPTLAAELLAGTAPAIAYLFLGIFTLTTYVLGGIAREQVCIYMCPWPRIQGAMVDHETLLVSYQAYRGEPRGPHKKGQTWEGRGDCIDCKRLRRRLPDRHRHPRRLAARMHPVRAVHRRLQRHHGQGRPAARADRLRHRSPSRKRRPRATTAPLRLVRPRTLLYAALIGIVGAIMLVALLNRSTLEINVLHDRNPPYVLLSDGGIRNGYTVKILNKLHEPHEFTLEVRGLARRAARHRRHGAGREDPRHHRRPARGARVRHRAARGARAAGRGRDAVRAGRSRRGLRARHRTHDALPEGGTEPGTGP